MFSPDIYTKAAPLVMSFDIPGNVIDILWHSNLALPCPMTEKDIVPFMDMVCNHINAGYDSLDITLSTPPVARGLDYPDLDLTNLKELNLTLIQEARKPQYSITFYFIGLLNILGMRAAQILRDFNFPEIYVERATVKTYPGREFEYVNADGQLDYSSTFEMTMTIKISRTRRLTRIVENRSSRRIMEI